jgi:hypothetical protein
MIEPTSTEMVVHEDFSSDLSARWRRYEPAGGALEFTGHSLRFLNRDTRSGEYSDAQIDDYVGLLRREFLWHPPLRMTVRARFSHPCGELRGTAGFGFWNDPSTMDNRLPTLPRAIWFFYASPESNMKLDLGTPGQGWKAATFNALRWPFFLLLPTAPLAVPLMNIRPLYRALWPLGQSAVGVSESSVCVEMAEWHTYVLDWTEERARFLVDDRLVLDCSTSPPGPLGFVMWLDNRYAIVTPWGRLGFGLLDAPGEQWLEVDTLTIEARAR